MALTITIPGAIEATTGATAPAVLTIGVGIPGPGVPIGGTAGQVLKKLSSTNYDTAWQTDLNSGVWGSITGTLSSQTDLQNALDAKLGTSTAASTYYPLTNPSAYITASALTPYLTTSAASSTYQTQAGMSSYLTTSAASSTYAPIAAGQPTSGTVGQVLTKASGTNYDSTWTTLIPGDRYLSTSSTSLTISTGVKSLTIGTGLSYSSQQDIVIAYDAANHMHAVVTSYNSGTGALVVDVQNKTGSGTYSAWTVNVGGTVPLQTVSWGDIVGTLGNQTDLATALNAKLDTSTASSTYAPLAGATFTGEVATPASTTSSAGFSIAPGTAPSAPTNGEIWNTGTELVARISGVSETLARQSWVTGQGYLTSSALTPYALKAGTTFTGLVTTVASATTGAGFNLPHGAAPTTPVNGDVWTTTGGFFWRQNGTTYQAVNLSGTQTVSGAITFSNATLTLGNSTAASTYNLGTGATLAATTKAINIGTNGVASSTTNIAIGSTTGTNAITINGPTTLAGTVTATGTTLDLGNSTGTATYSFGSGTTTTGLSKAVNIGTNGGTGSTTNITIGTSVGTSTTTLQGTTNGVTAAADNNTTALATTAYVVGQAGSATPLVDGTAAVGTSLRYARQDHVHPTDTSRAALASPTFTGTPAAPTAAADTNTTQLATTAFVVGQASSTAPVMDGTATVGTSLKYARADHVHASDTSKANLASPTFTGTPAAPTAAVDTNTTQVATTAFVVGQGYAKLASPALSGTPTAPTATAGTNTTQVATTAFVQAALPVAATETQAIYGTSSTTTISPLTMRYIMANPGYTAYTSLAGNYSSYVSGSASVSTLWSNFVGLSVTAANGKIAFMPNSDGTYHPFTSRGKAELNLDCTKPTWFSFRFNYSSAAGIGDSNTVNRVTIGKVSAYFGNLTTKGFGVSWTAGTTGAFTVMAHNGTTLTTVASAVTVSNTTYFPTTSSAADFLVYSDGTGNVTLYCNGTQVATTTGGPSSGNIVGSKFVFEADNTTSTSGNVLCDYTGIRTMYAY